MNLDQKILRARAKEISRHKIKQDDMAESLSVVEFLLIPERYGIESKYVSEVLSLREMTPIPGTPAFVAGVMNVRGKIVSILNLKLLFNLKERGITELNKIILVRMDRMEFGIVTDAIAGTLKVYPNTLSAPPANLHGINAEYIQGITPDGIILLNGENLLTNKTIIVNQK
jgi:purine-binding chemotaxis protein CheW